MVTCPDCSSEIPARKLVLLTNWNTVKCPKCSQELQVRNRNFASLLGSSGAVIEILVFFSLYYLHPNDPLVVALLVALIPILFILVMLVWIRFLELKVKS